MIKEIKNISLVDLLPDSLLQDAKLHAAAVALDAELQKASADCKEVIHLARLDALPEKVLDLLAWQWHVDFYEAAGEIEKKRAIIRQAIDWHRIKGTPYAVELALKNSFAPSWVKEWNEYSGDPYHFKVATEEVTTDSYILDRMRSAITSSANVRSVFDGFEFILHLMDELRAKERTLTSLSSIMPERYPWRGRYFDGGWCFSEVNAHGGTWQHDGRREYSGALDGKEDIPEMARAFDGEFGFNGRSDFWLRHATRKALFDSEEIDTLSLYPEVNAKEHYRSIGDFAGRDFSGGWHFGSDGVAEKGLTLIITRKTVFNGAWRFNGKKILGRYDWHEFGNAWHFDGTSSFGQKTYSA